MMLVPEVLVRATASWKELYDHSKTLQVIVPAMHVASLLFGGGIAIATDRTTLRVIAKPVGERSPHLEELAGIHRIVVSALACSAISGVLLLASDIETFWGSWLYWLKMVFVALLLLNGYGMLRAERAIRASADDETGWNALRRVSVASAVLWFATTIAGVALRETS